MWTFVKLFLNNTFKSWTVWAGILMSLLTLLPDVLNQVLSVVGTVSPALAVKVTAVILVVARLRSILLPILQNLGVKETAPPTAAP